MPPLRTAFGSRCAKSPIPCNRIDYFTAHFHIADVILLPSTEPRGFAATIGYGTSLSLFHRVEVGIGGTLSVWTPQHSGITIQNGPALLNVKGILFPLLRNPVPDSEFTFGLQLQQQLRIPHFDGRNDLGTETPLTALRTVADKPSGRKLRVLAPIEAIGHAIQNASREDVQRIAHAVVDGAIAFYHKPAYEKGASLGHATMSVASEVAIAVVTDGLGNLATLRKAERVADVAEHVRDASKAAGATTTVLSDVTVLSKGKIVGQGNVYLRPTIEKIESGGLRPRDTFTNREGLLPPRPAGYYKEYVHPTEGISGPGSQRIVRGAGGEMYYTPDHYKTFVPLHGSSSR